MARFRLTPAGYLRDFAGHAAGARSLAALLARDDVRCLVAEPDSRLTHMRHLADQWQARLVVIDVLGDGHFVRADPTFTRLRAAS